MATKTKSRSRSAQFSRYVSEHRREKSHLRRITKHLKKFPGDKTAQQALTNYRTKLGIKSA